MKKVVSMVILFLFMVSINMAYAKPNNGHESKGNSDSAHHSSKINSNAGSAQYDISKNRETNKPDDANKNGMEMKVKASAGILSTTPGGIKLNLHGANANKPVPPVLDMGRIHLPTGPLKNLGAVISLDKGLNTITITKGTTTITFVGDNHVYVNGIEIDIRTLKKGKGKFNPTAFIQKILRNTFTITTQGGITFSNDRTTTPEAVQVGN